MCRDDRAEDKAAGLRDLPFRVLSPKIKESAVRGGPLSDYTASPRRWRSAKKMPPPHPHPPRTSPVLIKGDQPGWRRTRCWEASHCCLLVRSPCFRATDHQRKVGREPLPGEEGTASQAPNDCSLCLTWVGPKWPASPGWGRRGQRLLQNPLIGCFSPPSEGTCPGGGSAGAGGRLEELQGRLIRHCHHSGLLLGGDHRHRLKQWICKSLSPAQMETAWPSTVWGLACPWPEAGSAAGKQGSPGRGLIDWSPLSPGGPTLRASNPLFPQTKLIGRNTWGEQPIH